MIGLRLRLRFTFFAKLTIMIEIQINLFESFMIEIKLHIDYILIKIKLNFDYKKFTIRFIND